MKGWLKRVSETTVLFLYSAFLGTALILSLLFYLPLQQTTNFTAGLTVEVISIRNIVLYIIIVFIIYIIVRKIYYKLQKLKICSEYQQNNNIFWKAFFINLFSWGIWFIVFYPGAGMNDTINLLMEPYQNSMQPFVYQVIIWYAMAVFDGLVKDMTIAYGIIVIVQMLFNSLILAYVVKWLDDKHINKYIVYAVMLYYAFLPAVADYSITLVKDTLFSVLVLLLIIQLYDIISQNGRCLQRKKILLAFILSASGICVFRNNGSFVIVLTLLSILIMKMCNKRYILLNLCIILALTAGITSIEKQRYSSDIKFREMIGVPLAQIGAVLNDNSAQLSASELAMINQILPAERWKENYRPSFADYIKFDSNFNNDWLNEHKVQFLDMWGSILKKNFPIYVKSYLCHSYGYWGILPWRDCTDYTQSFFTKVNNNTEENSIWGKFCIQHNLENRTLLPQPINNAIHILFRKSFALNLMVSPGAMFWLIAGAFAALIAKRRYYIGLSFLPVILIWLTLMIAAPASFIYRYSFYLILTLPVIVLLTIKELHD